MGYRLNQQRKRTKEVPVRPAGWQDGDDELIVSYNPHHYTAELEEIREEAKDNESAASMLRSYVLPLVDRWDLMDEYLVLDDDGRRVLKAGGPVATDEALGRDFVCSEYPVLPNDTRRFGLDGKPIAADVQVALDLLVTEERVVPLTERGLYRVPLDILSDVVKAISESMSPGEESATSLEGSFGSVAESPA